MGSTKCCSIVVFFSMVTLLSCFSPVSSYYIQPQVSRTNDALIIDFASFSYPPFLPGRGYGEIVNPGFIPVPSFNPYPLVQQQQPLFYNVWPFYSRQATAVQCGKGATTTPTAPARSLMDGRLSGEGVADAKKNVWSFMVYLSSTMGMGNIFFCSGTLISDTKVLLAAQCFEKMSLFEISTVTVKVGGFLASQSDAQMTRRISKVVIHSRFNSATYANDIAIITMDMPVLFSRTVGPVCLPPTSNDTDIYAGKDAVLLGWDKGTGVEPVDTSPADTLQQVLQTISYNSDCKTETFGKFVTDSTTCTTASTATFTCLSDVGGPLLVNSAPNTPGTNAVWTIVGINSYNAATSDTCTSGGLKTLVSAFIPWINTYMI